MLKQILSIFIIFFGLIFLVIPVFAQSDQEIAKKYGITFPIADLGNCANVASCKSFCDDPKNHQACSDFAKKHNLSSNSPKSSSTKSDEEILKLAKVELGCTSYDACMEFCEREENIEKCMDFAARHNLMKDATHMKQQMSALKNLLGCNSMKSCMDFCNNPINMQKCMEVFKQAGFSVSASYSGPGGCNSEESCRAYCEKNPKECGGDSFQADPPEVWCSKVAPDCKWDGTTCTCGGYNSPQESGDIWCPKAGPNCKWTGTICECPGQNFGQEGPPLGTDPTAWCNQNPGKCTYQNSGDVSTECTKYGCTWDGKTCQCPSSDEKVDFSSQCLSQTGCTWDANNNICSCSTGQQTPSENSAKNECEALPGCYWDNIDCRCSQDSKVQGTTTQRSLLERILDFILRR